MPEFNGGASRDELRIGIALSGGGVRASVFHLGVLGFIAQRGLLERVTFLSTVSGGSLAVALLYAKSEFRFPSSDFYLTSAVPALKEVLTKHDLRWSALCRLMLAPHRLLNDRALIFADTIKNIWGVDHVLADLPQSPRWVINATTYQTGVNWRFMPQRMGDYHLGYVRNPQYPLARAVAASAGFPGLIGPVRLSAKGLEWFKYEGQELSLGVECPYRTISLWDGGVYDNLGVEALIKPDRGFREGVNFLVVSDAGRPLGRDEPRWWHRRALRLINIATEQSRAMRARVIVKRFSEQPGTGAYLQLGSGARSILSDCGFAPTELDRLCVEAMNQELVDKAASFDTTLRKISADEFELLYQHGHEVARYTLKGRCPKLFS